MPKDLTEESLPTTAGPSTSNRAPERETNSHLNQNDCVDMLLIGEPNPAAMPSFC